MERTELESFKYFSYVSRPRPWETKELFSQAESIVDKLFAEGEIHLFFIPLEKVKSGEPYQESPDIWRVFITSEGTISIKNLTVDTSDPFWEYAEVNPLQNTANCIFRMVTYALAHGMDIAKVEGESAWSILYPRSRGSIHDLINYDS
jgi:hypothetical protein